MRARLCPETIFRLRGGLPRQKKRPTGNLVPACSVEISKIDAEVLHDILNLEQ